MSINFQFVKSVDEKLYDFCLRMDMNSKTFPYTSRDNLRKSLERFMIWFSQFNNIDLIKENGFNKTVEELINEAFEKKLLLPWQKNELDKIRKYGNKGIHLEPSIMKTNINYVKRFHKILAVYFRYKRLIDQPVFFDEDKLLISNYRPIQKIDVEKFEEGCEKKFLCEYIGNDVLKKKQYIVRQFRKNSKFAPDEKGFWQRDLLTLQRLSDEDLNYIVKSQNIETADNNDLFYTCYELSKADVNLTSISLQKLPVLERLDLLHQMAKGLFGIHDAYEPVYHRALTPSSIYIKTRRNGKKSILIGNFEYSKLEDVDGVTMVSKVFRRSNDPFRAPELEYGTPITDWAKVDVYSFGMIILFVFNIRGPNVSSQVQQLKKYNFSDEFIHLIERMVEAYFEDRPEMEEVESIFRKELKLYAQSQV